MTAADHGPRLLMLHKPRGVVVTRRDELGRKTVYDLLPPWARAGGWVPAGRLDRESAGLLLLTPDGGLVDRLTRPGGWPRLYEIWVRGRVTPAHLVQIRRGVPSPVGLLRAEAEVAGTAGPRTRLRVTLTEGRNRHLRRLFGALRDPRHGTPLKVLELRRLAIGPLALDLPSGQWRFLTPSEEAALR